MINNEEIEIGFDDTDDCDIQGAAASLPMDEEIFDIAEFFKVFSDSSRVKILFVLHFGELCVYDISRVLSMTVSAVSHQLKVLRQANLVKNRKDGRTVYYSLADDHVKKIIEMAQEHLNEL